MAKRLGEILLDEGKLTEEQLQKALKAQLIFGGHLGTSLIELGYIDEETLGKALSEAFKVPCATYEVLQNAPYAVIRAIPAKLVEKYKVVPIRLDGKTLHLAMMDPKNLMALDEISFVTGYRIEPWVAPEIRIYQILEKYYNIGRSQRYITLARELEKLRSPSERIRPSEEGDEGAEESAVSAPAEASAMPAARVAAAGGGGGSLDESALHHSTDLGEKYGYGRSWREYAEEMEKRTAPAPAPAATLPGPPEAAPAAAAPAPAPVPAETPLDDYLEEAARLLQRCGSPEDVADVVLSMASRRLARTAFFIVKGDRAVGWAGAGDGFHTPRIRGVSLGLERGSFYALMDDARDHFLGTLPAFPEIRQFFQSLNVPMPRTVLLVPIRIKGRIASFLYCDAGPDGDLRTVDAETFGRLAQKASLALQMIIIRNKIHGA